MVFFSKQRVDFVFLTTSGRRIRRFHRWLQTVILQSLETMPFRSPRRQSRWIAFGLAFLTWLFVLNSAPALGQAKTTISLEKAPVVVDGRILFEVGASGNFTAQQRAEKYNAILGQEVRSQQPVEIEVDITDTTITIQNKASERDPLTVTLADVIPGISPLNQAYQWRLAIEDALKQGQWERTPSYRRQALIIVAGVLLAAVFIQFGLRFLNRWISLQLRQWLDRPTLPLHDWESSSRLLLQLTFLGLQAGLWGAVCFYISDVFPGLRIWRYQLGNFLTSPILPLGENNYSARALLLLLASIVALWFLVSALTRFLRAYVLRQTGADPALQEVITTLTKYILAFLGLIVLLQIWKFDVSSFTILASILGVGIGFGVQNIANNFISGLIITLERPIQVGDFVNVGTLTGNVVRIGARSTEICSLDRVTIIVPNSRFLESEVINWSHGDSISRLRIPVGVAYGSNINSVKLALLEAARTHPDVLVSPRPQVWFQEFGDSALQFELLVWTGDPKQQPRIKSDLNYRIESSLRRHGIEVPFPQRDLHVRSPHLDSFINIWLQQQTPPSATLQEQSYNPEPLTHYTAALPAIASTKTEAETAVNVATSIQPPQLTESELKALVQQMQGAEGLEIKDHHYRLNIYPNCFTGSEAVAWLVRTQHCTRETAIAIGQQLMAQKIIHHVLDQATFQDGYLFYRFNSDSLVV